MTDTAADTPAAELDYVFEDYRLSPGEMVLRREGADLGLNRQSVEVLLHLVQAAGRVIPREEFIETFWARSPAGADNRLNTCIRRIRSALEDSGAEPEAAAPAAARIFTPARQFAGLGGTIAVILTTLVVRSVFFTPTTAELYPDEALALGPTVQTYGAYTVTDEGAASTCQMAEGVLACMSEGPGRVTFSQGETVIGAIAVATGRRVFCEIEDGDMRCDR
jgi:hypothetical protein